MRSIVKGAPDEHLVQQHLRPPTQVKKAKKRWKAFRKNKKVRGTRKQCLEIEQFGLCGYSEINLITGEGINKELGFHLDHLEPQSLVPTKTFDHDNLIVSAIDDRVQRVGIEDLFGGHARLDWWDDEVFIHPLLPHCSQYFHYEGSGRVVPKKTLTHTEEAKAQLTIDKLNLNASILVGWRKEWIEQKNALIAAFSDDIDVLRKLAREELHPQDGLLKPFHSAIRQLFGQIGEEIMAESIQAEGVA